MKKKADSQKKKDSSGIGIIAGTIIMSTALLFTLYEMASNPSNIVLIGGGAAVAIIAAAVTVLLSHMNIVKRYEKINHEYEDVSKSEKASYLIMRKSFNDIDARLAALEKQGAMPSDDIIKTQKAVAKVTINRSRENAEAILRADDVLSEKLDSVLDAISNLKAAGAGDELSATNEKVDFDTTELQSVIEQKIEELKEELKNNTSGVDISEALAQQTEELKAAIPDMDIAGVLAQQTEEIKAAVSTNDMSDANSGQQTEEIKQMMQQMEAKLIAMMDDSIGKQAEQIQNVAREIDSLKSKIESIEKTQLNATGNIDTLMGEDIVPTIVESIDNAETEEVNVEDILGNVIETAPGAETSEIENIGESVVGGIDIPIEENMDDEIAEGIDNAETEEVNVEDALGEMVEIVPEAEVSEAENIEVPIVDGIDIPIEENIETAEMNAEENISQDIEDLMIGFEEENVSHETSEEVALEGLEDLFVENSTETVGNPDENMNIAPEASEMAIQEENTEGYINDQEEEINGLNSEIQGQNFEDLENIEEQDLENGSNEAVSDIADLFKDNGLENEIDSLVQTDEILQEEMEEVLSNEEENSTDEIIQEIEKEEKKMPVIDDPNRPMTPDEIAALIASME